jgi:hypothetical protein
MVILVAATFGLMLNRKQIFSLLFLSEPIRRNGESNLCPCFTVRLRQTIRTRSLDKRRLLAALVELAVFCLSYRKAILEQVRRELYRWPVIALSQRGKRHELKQEAVPESCMYCKTTRKLHWVDLLVFDQSFFLKAVSIKFDPLRPSNYND